MCLCIMRNNFCKGYLLIKLTFLQFDVKLWKRNVHIMKWKCRLIDNTKCNLSYLTYFIQILVFQLLVCVHGPRLKCGPYMIMWYLRDSPLNPRWVFIYLCHATCSSAYKTRCRCEVIWFCIWQPRVTSGQTCT